MGITIQTMTDEQRCSIHLDPADAGAHTARHAWLATADV